MGAVSGHRRGRLLVAWLVLATCLAATAHAQIPTAPSPPTPPVPVPQPPLAPVLNQTVGGGLPVAENTTGQDLHGEDIRIDLALDVKDVDYQMVGIVFGGGKIAADAQATLHIEFRAVSLVRLDEALRSASGDANVSLNRTFGVPTGRLALTAEEIRLAGAGEVLQAFESFEAKEAVAYLESTIPGLAVDGLVLSWSGTAPAHFVSSAKMPTPADLAPGSLGQLVAGSGLIEQREPPLVLDASARLSFLERVSLVQLLTSSSGHHDTPAQMEKSRLRQDEGDTVGKSSAFNLIGYSQLLRLRIPAGWLLNVSLQVPRGFTIEGATQELDVSPDHRTVRFALDDTQATRLTLRPALATLSSRFLVTTTAAVAVGLIGYAVRLPLEAVILGVAARRHKRAKK